MAGAILLWMKDRATPSASGFTMKDRHFCLLYLSRWAARLRWMRGRALVERPPEWLPECPWLWDQTAAGSRVKAIKNAMDFMVSFGYMACLLSVRRPARTDARRVRVSTQLFIDSRPRQRPPTIAA